MKPVLEQKLRELMDESDRQIAPAMSTVLRILLNAYLRGDQNEFAKHCCKFSAITISGMEVNAQKDGDDGWSETNADVYIH